MKFDRKSIEGITPKEAWEFFVPMNERSLWLAIY